MWPSAIKASSSSDITGTSTAAATHNGNKQVTSITPSAKIASEDKPAACLAWQAHKPGKDEKYTLSSAVSHCTALLAWTNIKRVLKERQLTEGEVPESSRAPPVFIC